MVTDEDKDTETERERERERERNKKIEGRKQASKREQLRVVSDGECGMKQ